MKSFTLFIDLCRQLNNNFSWWNDVLMLFVLGSTTVETVLAPNYLQPGCYGRGKWRSIRHTAENFEYLILWETFWGEFRDVMETYEASKCVSNQKMKREKKRGFEIQFKSFNVKMVTMEITRSFLQGALVTS